MAKWCETCDRPVEGDVCEVCGSSVEEPTPEPMPLRWKFFVVATAIYLVWRLYQLIMWLSH
ncbi:MAG: hypothetical protein ACYDEH_08025 [Acidimicrobiales bacterium]